MHWTHAGCVGLQSKHANIVEYASLQRFQIATAEQVPVADGTDSDQKAEDGQSCRASSDAITNHCPVQPCNRDLTFTAGRVLTFRFPVVLVTVAACDHATVRAVQWDHGSVLNLSVYSADTYLLACVQYKCVNDIEAVTSL